MEVPSAHRSSWVCLKIPHPKIHENPMPYIGSPHFPMKIAIFWGFVIIFPIRSWSFRGMPQLWHSQTWRSPLQNRIREARFGAPLTGSGRSPIALEEEQNNSSGGPWSFPFKNGIHPLKRDEVLIYVNGKIISINGSCFLALFDYCRVNIEKNGISAVSITVILENPQIMVG